MRNKLAIRNWWMMAASAIFVLNAVQNYHLPLGSTIWRYMWIVNVATAVLFLIAAFRTPWRDKI